MSKTSHTTSTMLHCSQLESNPFQYRRRFSPDEMAELTASIQEHGVLQPILVRPVKGKKHAGVTHQIVAGERRWRATQAAGLDSIPAIVKELSDIEALSIALIENTQREDPDDWATAQGIKSLMKLSAEQGEALSERGVARQLGKSVSFVRNHLGLFKLHPDLQQMVQRHAGVRSSAYEIQKVKDTGHFPALIEAVDRGAAFQEIKRSVDAILAGKAWQRDSQRAPDAVTRQVLSKQERKAQEARLEVSRALQAAERELMQAAAFLPDLPRKAFKEEALPRLERLRDRLEQMSG